MALPFRIPPVKGPALGLLMNLCVLAPTSAQTPVQTPAQPAAPCDDCLPGVINFARLDGALWRGAQPSAEGFRALEKAGVRTVVSFRHDHDDLPMMKGTKLRYLRIPSRAWHANEQNLLAFLKVMEDPANWPVFIHCAQGRDRTGYNAAAYRRVVQGWELETVLKEMEAFRFNKVWIANPGQLRKLDPAALREKLKALPAPRLVTSE